MRTIEIEFDEQDIDADLALDAVKTRQYWWAKSIKVRL
jgi:hypothetical protein